MDRSAAGRELAAQLRRREFDAPIVLGLARGGLPVAAEVAAAISAPLDVLVVCKMGAPGNPELAIGAVAEGGTCVLNSELIRELDISTEELEASAARARGEVAARMHRYREGRPPPTLGGRTAIVVDDGLATGATARAALRDVRARGVGRLVLAVPVGAADTVAALRFEADEVVCLQQPQPMHAVGLWYEHFGPTTDEEIATLLAGARDGARQDARGDPTEVAIPVGPLTLAGDLALPQAATGLVVFAHGSGSSRHSPRNREVAEALNARGIATLLVDLLTPEEERSRANVFDIAMLASRLIAITRWVQREPALRGSAVGYFGASTGAAAALWAAADLGDEISAVVSRGGRPDLAVERLGAVRCPVLLIVGGDDQTVLLLNRSAQRLLQSQVQLEVVPHATHLFEEPGALADVARLAGDWFQAHLRTTQS